MRAIEGIDELDFDPARAVYNAERFSVKAFQRRLATHVADILERRALARAARERTSREASPQTGLATSTTW